MATAIMTACDEPFGPSSSRGQPRRGEMTEDSNRNSSNPAGRPDQQAMNTAVRILANRDHSKYELEQKLRQRGFTRKVIDTVMLKCERFNYINDPRTAHVYISQLKRKCFGKRYIWMALKKKHLNGSEIENILQENYPDADEFEKAGKLLEKKMEAFERESDQKKRREKIYRFLYARGFSTAVVSDLIRNLVK
jgi:regulatory protein